MVPTAIDNIRLRLQACTRMVNATAMNCDKASGDNDTCQRETSNVTEERKQYTTSKAKTDAGNTLPKYIIYLGVGLPGRKAMNGMKRVSIVATTPATTMMICCVIFIARPPFVFCKL